jgi:uncharacterized protein DUF3300
MTSETPVTRSGRKQGGCLMPLTISGEDDPGFPVHQGGARPKLYVLGISEKRDFVESERPQWLERMEPILETLFATWPLDESAYQDAHAPRQGEPTPPCAEQTPEQMQQLVAPIALYSDSLVAQSLAASMFPRASRRGRQICASAS